MLFWLLTVVIDYIMDGVVAANMAAGRSLDNSNYANLQINDVSRTEAAKLLNVSERTIKNEMKFNRPGNTGFFVPEILASNAAILGSSATVAGNLKQA